MKTEGFAEFYKEQALRAEEEIENLRAALSNAREALAEIAGLATYAHEAPHVDGVAHASRLAKRGLAASELDDGKNL